MRTSLTLDEARLQGKPAGDMNPTFLCTDADVSPIGPYITAEAAARGLSKEEAHVFATQVLCTPQQVAIPDEGVEWRQEDDAGPR